MPSVVLGGKKCCIGWQEVILSGRKCCIDVVCKGMVCKGCDMGMW